MLPQQLDRASGCRTMPTRCAESPGVIHFIIGSLVAVLQAQTSPIFEIQDPAITEFPTVMCPQSSQSGSTDVVLDLFDALNPVASFILRSDYCGLSYRHKHYQFPEFGIPL